MIPGSELGNIEQVTMTRIIKQKIPIMNMAKMLSLKIWRQCSVFMKRAHFLGDHRMAGAT